MALRRFISGLSNPTLTSWEISKITRQTKSPCLALLPNNAAAYDLKDDLRIFAPQLNCFFLPGLETDLLRNRGPSLEKRTERIRFLSTWSGAVECPPQSLFMLTPEALCQPRPIGKFWKDFTLQIKVGQELSRTVLAEELATLGYLAAELVEQATHFAVRGSIVDVFTPVHEYPARVELFEDRVQSIRFFHPDSQRRLSELASLQIPPSREFIFPENEGAEKLRSKIRPLLDHLDWDKKDRDALLSRFQQQSFFPSVDYWAPLISSQYYPPLFQNEDWIQDVSAGPKGLFAETVVVIEAQSLEGELRTSHKDIERNFLAARTDDEWVPGFDSFAAPLEEAKKTLDTFLNSEKSLWLSSKSSTALPSEPENKSAASAHGLEAFTAKLLADRSQGAEAPLADLAGQIKEWMNAGLRVVLASSSLPQLERLNFLLSSYDLSLKTYSSLEEISSSVAQLAGLIGPPAYGFIDTEEKIVLVLDEQIFGAKKKRLPTKKTSAAYQASNAFSDDLAMLDLKPGNLIVHKEHGIGRYLGLKVMSLEGVASELFEIEYRDGSKLFVPVTRLNVIQKHSSTDSEAPLDRLGGSTWESKKSKAKRELQSIAGELLHLYSQREMSRGPDIHPGERKVDEFAATFPYVETLDQSTAIAQTLKDMRGPKPMDRLICGDVGYGKTEIALRAAHAASAAGYQVAVLVPTTILAAQHEATFRKRLAAVGIKAEGLSRFKNARESKEILARIKSGESSVLIGTHRLLGQDVGFQKLGLLIIDEEQRFGVVHKEKIKKLRNNVHVLSMTATPIPRTLNMAMSGLKDLSIISTAPQDRLSVRTHVARKKPELIREAIETEIKRGGQVFYVHNRVQSMPKELEELQKLLPPGSLVESVHGQMNEELLEERMMNFYEGRTQVLLTTSIIESGLDVPNANTLIVDRADAFGLAQLYQIRGRVGRSSQRAYAYFLLPEKGNISQDAEERLSVLESYQELGSGFHIASHDLEIRGSGDFLGRSQSGQISVLGFDAYVQLLQECVAELKGEALESKVDPEINLGLDTIIPDPYIPEIGLRLMFYRKLAASEDESEIDSIEREIEDRFGPPGTSVRNLYSVMRIRCQLRRLGVKTLNAGKAGFSVAFDSSTPVNVEKMVKAVQRYPNNFQMSPDGRLLIKRRMEGATVEKDAQKIMRGIEAALSEVESWCG